MPFSEENSFLYDAVYDCSDDYWNSDLEDDLVDEVHAGISLGTNEPADTSRTWKQREQFLKNDSWLWDNSEDAEEILDVELSAASDDVPTASDLDTEMKYATAKVVFWGRVGPDSGALHHRREHPRQSLRSMQFAIAAQLAKDKLEDEIEYETFYGHESEDDANAAACDRLEQAERTRMFEHCIAHEGSDAYDPFEDAELNWTLHQMGIDREESAA